MPSALSLPHPPVKWFSDTWWPAKSTAPTAAGTATDFSTALGSRPFIDAPLGNSYLQGGGVTSNVGTTELLKTVDSFWACEFSTVGAATPTRARIRRWNAWAPELSSSLAPTIDDGMQRLAWSRLWLYTGDTNAGAGDDNVGIALVPDDGAAYAPASYRAKTVGGFGIFKRPSSSNYRYASYGAAGALLEAQNLSTGAGWHVADFLIREAKRDDATTPWLSFRWDGVDVFTARTFGDALLPTPQSLKANAHGWALFVDINNEQSTLTWATRFRMGPQYPNGTPIF